MECARRGEELGRTPPPPTSPPVPYLLQPPPPPQKKKRKKENGNGNNPHDTTTPDSHSPMKNKEWGSLKGNLKRKKKKERGGGTNKTTTIKQPPPPPQKKGWGGGGEGVTSRINENNPPGPTPTPTPSNSPPCLLYSPQPNPPHTHSPMEKGMCSSLFTRAPDASRKRSGRKRPGSPHTAGSLSAEWRNGMTTESCGIRKPRNSTSLLSPCCTPIAPTSAMRSVSRIVASTYVRSSRWRTLGGDVTPMTSSICRKHQSCTCGLWSR